MLTEKTEAIVLRAIPWSETSLVVTLWTKGFGKISAIAKGARRLRSPFESALDLLAESYVVFISKTGDSLDLLTEAKLVRRFRSGQQGLISLYCGFFVAEVLTSLTEENEPIPELFDLTRFILQSLDGKSPPGETLLRFELHTLRLLGHSPSFQACAGCGEVLEMSQASNNSVAFGIQAGGVLCRNCLPGQRQIVRLGLSTLDYLSRVQEQPWDDDDWLKIPDSSKAEVRGLMNKSFREIRHREFALHPFLEDLGR